MITKLNLAMPHRPMIEEEEDEEVRPLSRQQLQLAHELGHYLLGHDQHSRGYQDSQHQHVPTRALGFDWRAERAQRLRGRSC